MIRFLYQYFRRKKYKIKVSPGVIYKKLLKSQFWSLKEIKEAQLKQLNILLNLSKNTSEYYARQLQNISIPLNSLEEATGLPTITKNTIRQSGNIFRTKFFTDRFKNVTSGSSGDPIVIYISDKAQAYRMAGRERYMSWWNLKTGDRSVLIWGKKATQRKNSTILECLREKLHNRLDINVFDLNKDSIYHYYQKIEHFKPVYIRGYKSAIYQLAELMMNNNLMFKNAKPKVAIVTSEVLLKEERSYIEGVLKCRVVNEYGSADGGLFAFECPEGSMHIFEEAVLIDTDNEGYIISTELFNDSMPLINYKIDDCLSISKEKCRCGRNLRTISDIKGRLSDFVIKPDGSKISQYVFYYIMKEIEDLGFHNTVKKYKVTQTNNSFEIKVIKGNGFSTIIEEYILKRLKNEIGEDIIVKFVFVDEIEREASGKLRFFKRIE